MLYATNNFELAVKLYFWTKDSKRKNRIYNKKIYPIIKKIVYGILKKYKLKYTYLKRMKNKQIFDNFASHFHQYFHNFDHKKGKAFSYITRSFQNFMMKENIKPQKHLKRYKEHCAYFPEYYNNVNTFKPTAEKTYLEKCEEKYFFDKLYERINSTYFDKRCTQDVKSCFLEIMNEYDGEITKRNVYEIIRNKVKLDTRRVKNRLDKVKKVYLEHKKEFYNL